MREPIERIGAVIVAAGAGTRFGGDGPRKQYRLLAGEPLVCWSIRPFVTHPRITHRVLVLPPDDVADPPAWLRDAPVVRVAGGANRGDSVRLGIASLADSVDLVLVHDGARPFATRALIDRVIEGAESGGAAVPGIQMTDTLKEVDANGTVIATPDRRRFWRVQTPQAFPLDELRSVHRRALDDGISATDDAALFERYGLPVQIVPGEEQNLKVTTPLDLTLAELLAQRLPGDGR